MAPSSPQNGHIWGPGDVWEPKQGVRLACDQICISPRAAKKSTFWVVLARFGPPAGAKLRKVPQTPNNPANRELRPQKAEPSKVAKVAQHERGSDEPEKS